MMYKSKAQKKYEIAICFARMYGVKETLEPLPFVENEVIVDKMVQWAEEYLESGHYDEFYGGTVDDMAEFFFDKCEKYSRERGLGHES